MREIKFRVFDDVNFGTPQIRHFNIYQAQFINHIEKLEIMQYTGIKDKNGKGIYEGDLLKDKFNQFGKVFYKNCSYRLTVDHKGINDENIYDYLNLDLVKLNNLEVIGNIYENPSLVEG